MTADDVYRVAQQESSNCMSPQGLAISFAPSILRTMQQLSPVESLRHVNKQAEYVLLLDINNKLLVGKFSLGVLVI